SLSASQEVNSIGVDAPRPDAVSGIVSQPSIAPSEQAQTTEPLASTAPVVNSETSSDIWARGPPAAGAPSAYSAHNIHLTPDQTLQGDLLLSSSDRLTGTGKIYGDVVNDGVVSPGNSPGIQQFTNFTQSADGTLIIEVEGVSAPGVFGGYDQVQ